MVFEDFGFDALGMVTSHSMIREDAVKNDAVLGGNPCHLVIDSGFSFTYGVPFFGGVPMK